MFNGTYGFKEPESKEERDEFRNKFRQHKNEINNPCIKVGMEGLTASQKKKKNPCYGNRKFNTMFTGANRCTTL